MRKFILIFLVPFMLSPFILVAQSQGISNIWLMGYNGGLGETKIDFSSGIPVINQNNVPMDFNHTFSSISDSTGNLLFYTNGVYIADATHDTMMNGSGINPGAYSNFVPDGHLIPQGALIIKKPGWNNLYYLFHSTCDQYPANGCTPYQLYLTIIDMDLNGGLGAAITKNYPIIIDSLNTGKITAVKHANGRDWWVVCHRVNTNKYYKLLVTPYGLPTVFSQNIGSTREWDAGQAKFSPDGSKFAYFHYRFTGLDIFDFDRCTGVFSNWVNDSIPLVIGNVGCEFSPNSHFLYVSNILKVYQYDMLAANIISSRTEVAVWDSFAQPGIPNLGAYLCLSQLAPDGKIYITTGNSTTYMGRINEPDLPGVACDVDQHSVLLPTYYFNTIPNHPNYFLGKISGSPCDTVTGVGLDEPPDITVSVYPNPSNGNFTLSFPVQNEKGEVEIYNVNGKLVLKEYIAPWSQYKRMELSHLNKGIYFCKVRWQNSTGQVKVFIE